MLEAAVAAAELAAAKEWTYTRKVSEKNVWLHYTYLKYTDLTVGISLYYADW